MSVARTCLAVILAAGEGTRMKSAWPKVLHKVAGRSMLAHAMAAAEATGAGALAVVHGPGRDDVAAEALRHAPAAEMFIQAERLGTAHAVLAAREAISRGFDDLLILYADVPLVRPETLLALRAALAPEDEASEGAALAVLGFEAADPQGYGRLLMAEGELLAIREHKDATPAERGLRLCNSGLMAFQGRLVLDLLGRIGRDNAQGEYYLTDAVELARRDGRSCRIRHAEAAEVLGVNDRVQLAAAEREAQRRLRIAAMQGGATLIAPETVFLSADTRLGRDVLIEPHVIFGPGVVVESGAVIHGFSHLEGAFVEKDASVGPYGRLRPGAHIGPKAKVGNFVEIKSSTIAAGAKVSHLSYIGDASVGAGANIGAGTITCNYDGFNKFKTGIGAGAFIGSNSALVAPVSIGADAFVASGSVITEDVPDDALAFGRARQTTKPGGALALRASLRAARARKP